MSKTALLMIQDPRVMGVEIQNAKPDEAVEGFTLYLQENVLAPLVEKVGEDEDVADAYEAFMEGLDNGSLDVLSRLTNELLSEIASAGVSVPLVVMTVQEDLEGSEESYAVYDAAQAILRPAPERYEYHGGCTYWYTVVSTDEAGRRHAAEFQKFDDATAYMLKADAVMRLTAVMVDDRYDSGKSPVAEWDSDDQKWYTIQ